MLKWHKSSRTSLRPGGQLGTCEGRTGSYPAEAKGRPGHLAGVLSSWSWRVTEPTRRVRAVLRRASARWGGRSALTLGTVVMRLTAGRPPYPCQGGRGLDIQALLTDNSSRVGHGGRSAGNLIPSCRRSRGGGKAISRGLDATRGAAIQNRRTPVFRWRRTAAEADKSFAGDHK